LSTNKQHSLSLPGRDERAGGAMGPTAAPTPTQPKLRRCRWKRRSLDRWSSSGNLCVVVGNAFALQHRLLPSKSRSR
jgi:hypothetical protein